MKPILFVVLAALTFRHYSRLSNADWTDVLSLGAMMCCAIFIDQISRDQDDYDL